MIITFGCTIVTRLKFMSRFNPLDLYLLTAHALKCFNGSRLKKLKESKVERNQGGVTCLRGKGFSSQWQS